MGFGIKRNFHQTLMRSTTGLLSDRFSDSLMVGEKEHLKSLFFEQAPILEKSLKRYGFACNCQYITGLERRSVEVFVHLNSLRQEEPNAILNRRCT